MIVSQWTIERFSKDDLTLTPSFFGAPFEIMTMTRCELSELSDKSYDVIVVGAGINGAGAAQQLIAQGYRVLIIDKSDFSGGATSKSSRILHCGLRYLAPGKSIWDFVFHPTKFFLACQNARKSMIARSDISSSMKELVRPFRFCFPIYKSGPYRPWQVDFAFKLLDMLGPHDNPLEYQRYSGKNLDIVPFKNWFRDHENLRSVSVFKDYQFVSAERLVVDTIRDAADMGATVRNYTLMQQAKHLGEGWHVTLKDVLKSEEVTVKAKLILNVTGPWGDQVNQTMKSGIPNKVIGLKGAHIVVKLPEEFSEWGTMVINRANEPMYFMPWHGMHYIGINRTPYDGNLDDVKTEMDEAEWLLGEVNYVFPPLNLQRKDILYSYAGIQPVTFDAIDPQGNREVVVHDLESEGLTNVLMLTGGPIMTYRLTAKELLKEVSKRCVPTLEKQHPSYGPSEVSQLLRNGKASSVSMNISEDILKRIIVEEQPVSLADILLRRTGLGWDMDQGESTAPKVANVMAELFGWDQQRKEEEIQLFHQHIKESYQRP